MHIRDATPADAAAACEVLRASIIELCVADHHNDPAILGAWLANKRPEIVARWSTEPASSLFLAVEGDAILGVGGVKDSGEITLNYVAPAPRTGSICRVDTGTMARRSESSVPISAIR